MLLQDGKLTVEGMKKLREYADLIECECPNKLMDLLDQVRGFETYTVSCIDKYPKDAKTHKWLKSSAVNVDALLSSTIIQLARMEGFINEKNEFVSRKELSASK